jgi:hypothetical protein
MVVVCLKNRTCLAKSEFVYDKRNIHVERELFSRALLTVSHFLTAEPALRENRMLREWMDLRRRLRERVTPKAPVLLMVGRDLYPSIPL